MVFCDVIFMLIENLLFMQRYLQHIRKHDQVMQELEEATKKYKDFEVAYKEFEVSYVLNELLMSKLPAYQYFKAGFSSFSLMSERER